MSSQQQNFFDEMWPLCINAASKCGVNPEIIFAQSALETGYGLHVPQDNYFGIKPSNGEGTGYALTTTEYINGKAVQLKQHFVGYSSMADSVAGYTSFVLRNKRYAAFTHAGSLAAQLALLGKSGYATDPSYVAKLAPILDRIQALEKVYNSLSHHIVSALAGTVVTMPPSQKPIVATHLETKMVEQNPIASFLAHNASVLTTAANVIEGILSVAPVPAAAATGLDDVLNLIKSTAATSKAAADNVVVTPAATASTATVGATGIVTTTAAETPIKSFEGSLLQAAIADAQQLAVDIGGDLVSGGFTSATLKTAEAQAEQEGAALGVTAATGVAGLLQPIAKPPTAN